MQWVGGRWEMVVGRMEGLEDQFNMMRFASCSRAANMKCIQSARPIQL